ncbi:hypothetical protein ACSSS7_006425 [Eimeria intestinalis]
MDAMSRRQRNVAKGGKAMQQAEATEIRSLVVPLSTPPAGSYCGHAEKEQLLRGVVNSLHDEYLGKLGTFSTRKGAVAQELLVDFPQCKRQEAPQQLEAAEAATERETIDMSAPTFTLQSQQGKDGKQDAQRARDAESLKATKLFRMFQRLASDPVDLEDLAQLPHSMSQQPQPHSLAASICKDDAATRAHQELSSASSLAVNAAVALACKRRPLSSREKSLNSAGGTIRPDAVTFLHDELANKNRRACGNLTCSLQTWQADLSVTKASCCSLSNACFLDLVWFTAAKSGRQADSVYKEGRKELATLTRPHSPDARGGRVGVPRRSTTEYPQAAMEQLAAAAAAASSAAAIHSRELLSFGTYSRVKWRGNKRTFYGAWSLEEQLAVLRNLRNSFLLPYAAFRRRPLVSVSAMQKRISTMIGERIPVEFLTRHALSPPQLAKIQAVLYSKPIAILAFAFCHLLHWLCFGQTRRDKPHSAASAGLNDSVQETAGLPTAASISAFFSEDQMKTCGEAHQRRSQVKGRPGRPGLRSSSAVDLREQKLLSRGQEILRQGAAPYQRCTQAKRLVSQDPEAQLAESLLHFSKQALGECKSFSRCSRLDSGSAPSQRDGQVNALEEQCFPQDLGGLEVPLDSFDRRLKALALAETLYKQIVRKIKTTFGAFGVNFVCPLMVLAMKEAAAWAIRHQMPKLFKQSFLSFELADRINALFSQLFDPQSYFTRHTCNHAETSSSVKLLQLEKYLTNCPKPPVSDSECFQAICTPLDLSSCTAVLQRQLQQLHEEVEQRSSLLQLRQTNTPTPSHMSHKKADPQYKLLCLQQEQHELLDRRNAHTFEPIRNWACPGQALLCCINCMAPRSGSIQECAS